MLVEPHSVFWISSLGISSFRAPPLSSLFFFPLFFKIVFVFKPTLSKNKILHFTNLKPMRCIHLKITSFKRYFMSIFCLLTYCQKLLLIKIFSFQQSHWKNWLGEVKLSNCFFKIAQANVEPLIYWCLCLFSFTITALHHFATALQPPKFGYCLLAHSYSRSIVKLININQ